jgi:hypothetical protein
VNLTRQEHLQSKEITNAPGYYYNDYKITVTFTGSDVEQINNNWPGFGGDLDGDTLT